MFVVIWISIAKFVFFFLCLDIVVVIDDNFLVWLSH